MATAKHLANGQGEIACEPPLCDVAGSAGGKCCRNIFKLFVDGEKKDLRASVFFTDVCGHLKPVHNGHR